MDTLLLSPQTLDRPKTEKGKLCQINDDRCGTSTNNYQQVEHTGTHFLIWDQDGWIRAKGELESCNDDARLV